ncbi:MAG: S8 family serine peptidase [Bdellovibrionota bacterium]
MKSFIILSLSIFLIFESATAALPIFDTGIMVPQVLSGNAATPDFTSKQFYLEDAPQGIGARSAWSLAGGTGENVKIIDIEIGYEQKHEDLAAFFFSPSNFPSIDLNHGSAVLGVLAGQPNSMGIIGIAHAAEMGFIGFKEGAQDDVDQPYIDGINEAIKAAISKLEAGDVLVIEQHMVGPDSRKYTAVEYWEPIFNELKKATDAGIHCVEAAGNGGSNFDSPVYGGAFDLKLRDSGCIMVGAGSAQSKERLGFSNYGSRVDAFGFGEMVTTIGYGDLFNDGSPRAYTQRFNGTSSATPIVAGAVAVVSSIAEAQGVVITPTKMREALRATGTSQGPMTKEKRIGNLPNVSAMLEYLNLK